MYLRGRGTKPTSHSQFPIHSTLPFSIITLASIMQNPLSNASINIYRAESPAQKARFSSSPARKQSIADKEESHALKTPTCFSTFQIFTEHEFAGASHSLPAVNVNQPLQLGSTFLYPDRTPLNSPAFRTCMKLNSFSLFRPHINSFIT